MSMVESSKALFKVLQSCYPACQIDIRSLDDVIALLLGGEKYDIERATQQGIDGLGNFAKPEAKPFAAYVVASRFGF